MSKEKLDALEQHLIQAEKLVRELRVAWPVEPALPLPTPTTPSTPPPAPYVLADPGKFYDKLRASAYLGPKISQEEFEGCEALLHACGQFRLPLAHMAYVFATAYHETAGTMQPIKERGGDAYLHRMYDIEGARPNKARELGNVNPGDGVLFGGRGYPQVTGRRNYRVLGQALGLPLEQQPDLLLRADIAAPATVIAMRDGLFTGKRLSSALPAHGKATKQQFIAGRPIINGTDRAEHIADVAMVFQDAADEGRWGIAA